MPTKKTLTFVLMDPPFESARSTTALRLIDLALQRGHDVNVFAYEGAVALSFAGQEAHANAVHGRDLEEEDHPLPRDWIAALLESARKRGVQLDWVNCGLCVDERGVGQWPTGPRRGGPPDFLRFIEESHNTLVIPTAD
jgi:tRNA 2-thiouridine synthesizing protein D